MRCREMPSAVGDQEMQTLILCISPGLWKTFKLGLKGGNGGGLYDEQRLPNQRLGFCQWEEGTGEHELEEEGRDWLGGENLRSRISH